MNNLLTRRGGAVLRRCRAWISGNFGGSSPALCHTAAAVTALVAGSSLAAVYWPRRPGYAVLCCGVLAAAELGIWLAQRLLRRLLGRGLGWLMSLGLLLGSIAYTVKRGAGEGWTWRVWLFSALTAGTLWLLAASWWSVLRRRRLRPVTVSAALLSAGAAALLAVFLFTGGFDDHYIRRYLALLPAQEAGPALDIGNGPLQTAVLDYGPGGTVEAGTFDLTSFVSRDTGDLTGSYVDAYWDYDLSEVPMVGRVWYPADRENCPVLFIAHGNHEIVTQSYLGYGYLGEYLASYGYVVVSVDQNSCNLLTGENDGRAVLLLEHIGLLLGFSDTPDSPLYRKLDPERIAIAGHSRGGEMVATAYLFNGYDRYPENGAIAFDYNYNIRSIIALAPTVNQYMPADHSVELEDVNYLLLHGAADRDVRSFMGMTQYENISFTGQGDYLKTALYIAGANHGQFNELWGAYDQSGPFARLLNVESLLSEADQQEIARVFIKVFLDVTLLGEERCRTLLTDWDSCGSQLPETVYVQCYETSAFRPIADFEEDSDLETAAMEGASLSAGGMKLWTEELIGLDGSTAHDAHALRLRWQRRANVKISVPALDLTGQALTFDLCDLDSAAVERGEIRLADGEVVLTDENGGTAAARISDFAAVFPILPVRTDKLDFLFDTYNYKKAFATVTIPAGGFTHEGDFDFGRIAEVSFVFDGSGEVMMDNIGIEAAE
ncbi:MAG: chlorophyllase [Oscillospiraceae bacterium]|nr:chlorophyllase [Oscillospiraceae bacterium]